MAEIINCLAGDIAAISFVGGNLGHGKVRLRKYNTFRVDTNKNLRHTIDIQVLSQSDNSKAVILNTTKPVNDIVYL